MAPGSGAGTGPGVLMITSGVGNVVVPGVTFGIVEGVERCPTN